MALESSFGSAHAVSVAALPCQDKMSGRGSCGSIHTGRRGTEFQRKTQRSVAGRKCGQMIFGDAQLAQSMPMEKTVQAYRGSHGDRADTHTGRGLAARSRVPIDPTSPKARAIRSLDFALDGCRCPLRRSAPAPSFIVRAALGLVVAKVHIVGKEVPRKIPHLAQVHLHVATVAA